MTYSLCAGLDYVGHEDVLPYKTTQKQPIFNHLFDKFLVASETSAGTIATPVNQMLFLLLIVSRHSVLLSDLVSLHDMVWTWLLAELND